MPKVERNSFRTSLSISEIKEVLTTTLAGSTISPLESGPLDDTAPELAVLADRVGGAIFNRSPYGSKLAAAQIVASDRGDHRLIELVALGTTFSESFSSGRAATRSSRNAFEALGKTSALRGENPDLKCSRKMVSSIEAALRAADGGLTTE